MSKREKTTQDESALRHLEQAWAYWSPPDARPAQREPEYFIYVPSG